MSQEYNIDDLPPKAEFHTRQISKALVDASRALSDMRGEAKTIPNETILVSTLPLQEAQASSKIENIYTTQEELLLSKSFPEKPVSAATKEVDRYREALWLGYEGMVANQRIISNNLLIKIFQHLKQQEGGFRKVPGIVVGDGQTGEVLHRPPEGYNRIIQLMSELEAFINNDEISDLDPLIKMAIIHHQFESIHPFIDGNGRLGRILNVLYLTKMNLLDLPILYMSREITRTKGTYYRLLADVRDHGNWEEWVVYMLECIRKTSREAQGLISNIKQLMSKFKTEIRTNYSRIYSQDLLNHLFCYPYTRIDYLGRDIDISRPTAAKYLKILQDHGLLNKIKLGRDNYYINQQLVDLLIGVSQDD